MFTPTLRCECAQPGLIDTMRKWSIGEIRAWMTVNYLKLNDAKTEVFFFFFFFFVAGTSYNIKQLCLDKIELTIGSSTTKPSKVIRNLGVYFDNTMTLSSHIDTRALTMSVGLLCITLEICEGFASLTQQLVIMLPVPWYSRGKSYKNSFSTYLTHIHTCILLTLLTYLPYQFWKKNTNLSGMVSLWYDSWCWFLFATFWNNQ